METCRRVWRAGSAQTQGVLHIESPIGLANEMVQIRNAVHQDQVVGCVTFGFSGGRRFKAGISLHGERAKPARLQVAETFGKQNLRMQLDFALGDLARAGGKAHE